MEFLFISLVTIIYIMPAYVAFVRRHRNRFPILIINLCLGWMLLPWVLTLAWSASSNVDGQRSSP